MFGFGGLTGPPRVRGHACFGNFGGSVASLDRYVNRDTRSDPVRWHIDRQVDRDRLRRLSSLFVSLAENKRNSFM